MTVEFITQQNVYAVTHATLDERGIHYQSELAIQLADGKLTTLRMPTRLSERKAIEQVICQQYGC